MTANTPQTKKAKGSRLEKKFASLIRQKGLDKNAKRQLMSGASYLKGDIYTTLPYSIECKNTEKHKIWEEWNQAVEQCPLGKDPVLVISGNYRPILVTMEANDWLNLVKEAKND